MQNRKDPLVLTGVEYLFPLYKDANTYPHLVDKGITGNTKILKPEELQAQAWEIVKPLFEQAHKEAVEQ